MNFIIEESIDIEASPELVWEVLTDLPRYGEWNPFVVECASTLEPGDPIEMKVQIFDSFAQPQNEVIFEREHGRRICYGLAPMPLGSIASHRCHVVEPLPAGRTRYHSEFKLEGWLAPLVRGLVGARLERGFASMTQAVCQRAELLREERA
ncbi:MAG: SRPBCC domain-containing protein [Deltaproteobacteria bacterium]|nr:SRPBCC domain-containing protein [Deltaproteobacteria bacterium]